MLHDQPNPAMPAHRFWSTVTAQLLLWGNAFIRKERNAVTGLVESLWLLDPAHVMVEWNPVTGRSGSRSSRRGGQARASTATTRCCTSRRCPERCRRRVGDRPVP
jgi:phage portal protein BeeE